MILQVYKVQKQISIVAQNLFRVIYLVYFITNVRKGHGTFYSFLCTDIHCIVHFIQEDVHASSILSIPH